MKNAMVYNFLIRMLLECSIQIFVFALINIKEPVNWNSRSELSSFVIACVYTASLLLLAIANIAIVIWFEPLKNPTLAVLYEKLKP